VEGVDWAPGIRDMLVLVLVLGRMAEVWLEGDIRRVRCGG
jgi:hypothetical protein